MPTKAERKVFDAAVTGFNACYSSTENWGSERWNESLHPALSRPTRHAALLNLFVPRETFDSLINKSEIGPVVEVTLPDLGHQTDQAPSRKMTLYRRDLEGDLAGKTAQFPPPALALTRPGSDVKLYSHWNLDAASVLCAHMLQVKPSDRVLDLCAAPGGKSIALAQVLFPHLHATSVIEQQAGSESGRLHVNEMDASRHKRLSANLHAYLPAELFTSSTVRIFNLDASDARSFTRFPHVGKYDKVLVDAPCSSERHLIQSHQRAVSSGQLANSELVKWRRGTSRKLQKTQVALAMTALRLLRKGGTMVYSTCSIEADENDGVLEKLRDLVIKERKKETIDFDFRCVLGRAMQHSNGNVTDAPMVSPGNQSQLDTWTEETEYGRIALPDHPSSHQSGPLFFCIVIKT